VLKGIASDSYFLTVLLLRLYSTQHLWPAANDSFLLHLSSDVIKTFFQDQDQDQDLNFKTKTLKFFQDQDQA